MPNGGCEKAEEIRMAFDRQKFLAAWKAKTQLPPTPLTGGWTLQARQKQALAIHRWKPWESSTGPRTDEGKEKVAQNARRHGQKTQINAG